MEGARARGIAGAVAGAGDPLGGGLGRRDAAAGLQTPQDRTVQVAEAGAVLAEAARRRPGGGHGDGAPPAGPAEAAGGGRRDGAPVLQRTPQEAAGAAGR